jgi:ABC-type Fe3+-hydroxamate transport system substrate-binding protein
MFCEFAESIDELKAETHSLLQDLRAKGKRIAGFGASITGTTLIYHFGIGEFLDYLIDDNPAKQGRFSPGLHLPVFSSEKLYERKPDYVVILAWRFVEPIVKKNNAYLEQGGHFIVPVPEVRII